MPEQPNIPPMKKSHRNLSGVRFGRLIVTSNVPHRIEMGKNGFVVWSCKCDCGKNIEVRALSLLSPPGTKSCGCLQRDKAKSLNLRHGHSKKRNWTPEYKAWAHMMNRCVNPNDAAFKDYGGRGISVCERWKRFDNFLSDVGLRPSPKYSLDRINNDGNYEPSNIRWATKTQQMRNRRGLHLLTFNGKTQCLSDWADEIGSTRELIRSRLRQGRSIEEALFATKYAKR